MRNFTLSALGFMLPLLACSSNSSNANNQTGMANVAIQVAFPMLSFNLPVALVSPGDGTNRLFVEEQDGRILVFENSSTASTVDTFLNITDRVARQGQEEGLLGLAFDPDYRTNGYVYVNYTAPNPLRSRISRFKVSTGDSNRADAASELILLEYNQPFENHNGGCLQFGPDGDLYIGVGDGGSAGDPNGNGQNRSVLLGKILRIDVRNSSPANKYAIPPDNPLAGNSSGFKEEIFAYGMRNPWRFSFDQPTGRLWCADVGQDTWEEIDLIENGSNYGWNVMEGNHCFKPASGCQTAGLTMPIWEYNHSVGQCITGGYVYHGISAPALTGLYIYADFVAGQVWALDFQQGRAPTNSLVSNSGLSISSFGTDQNNELYMCAFDGKIYRFVAE